MAEDQSTQSAGVKTSVRQDPDRAWRVTYACACPPRRLREWWVAMIFATKHQCPEPWPDLPVRHKRGRRWV